MSVVTGQLLVAVTVVSVLVALAMVVGVVVGVFGMLAGLTTATRRKGGHT